MQKIIKKIKNKKFSLEKWQNIQITILGILISFVLVFSLYLKTTYSLTKTNNESLLYLTKVAALQFDAKELFLIQETEDITTETFLQNAQKLEKIRESNEDIASTYILRKTNDPKILKFIIDVDYKDEDTNEDGIITEEEEAILPGDEYEVEQAPLMLEGFKEAIYEPEVYADIWGATRSAYAPIKDAQENSVAILGIDITQDVFLKNIRLTRFFSIGIFIIFTCLVIYISYLFQNKKVLMVQNLLEKEENKRLEKLNEIKNQFIAIVSHELKTPMSVVKGCVSMLLEETLGGVNEQQKAFLGKIGNSTNMLINLVNNIVDLHKLETDIMAINIQPIFLKKLIEDIVNKFEPAAKNKNLKISYLNKTNIEEVLGDEQRIKQILDNLVDNAIKFTSEGEVKILIEEFTEDKNLLLCKVIDTGVGIPANKIEHIFDKFSQSDSHFSREQEGAGLGLPIVKSLTEKLKGKIWAESVEGKGSSFIFTLKKSDLSTKS